jgi:hypothetical protein
MQSLLCTMVQKSACHGYRRNPLPFSVTHKHPPSDFTGYGKLKNQNRVCTVILNNRQSARSDRYVLHMLPIDLRRRHQVRSFESIGRYTTRSESSFVGNPK